MVSIALWILIIIICLAFFSGAIMGFYIGVYKARTSDHMFFDEEEVVEEVENKC
jgi:hypothetical protein